MLSRRQFIKQSTVLLTSLAAPSLLGRGQTAAQANAPSTAAWLPNYLSALDSPQFAPLNDIFADLQDKEGNLCLLVYDLLNDQLLTGIQTEAPMPVASAFKGPLFLYFMDMVDPAVWSQVPPIYWDAGHASQVPEEYRDAWQRHNQILRDLFQTVVRSENSPAGHVLAYVAQHLGSRHPLALFNDWSHQVVSVSQMSSMSGWNQGIPNEMSNTDDRYTGRMAILSHQMVSFYNLVTARDLGLYYVWWQSRMTDAARRVGQEMLSYIYQEQHSNIEQLAQRFDGLSYSKNGSLAAVETGVSAVVTDAGLLNLPDYGYFVVAFLSGDADSRTPTYFERIGDIVRGDHQQRVEDHGDPRIAALQQARFYESQLERAYPDAPPVYDDRWNYAFVKYEGVSLYSSPDDNQPVRNPVISSSRFGVHLLMQGALVRYLPVNDDWARLIPDSPRDNVQQRLGEPLYVRRRHLHPIGVEHASPIPYLVDDTITSEEKMVVIDVRNREMTLLERLQPVVKTPIVLNDIDTPRGGHLTYTKWFANSMQPWAPGVPFVTYFHPDGFAIHGSPWQRWELTINKTNLQDLFSAGCVNVPNWVLSIGEYTLPLDEIVFRWLGGMLDPTQNAVEYGSRNHPTVRIYLVDRLDDLDAYYRPPAFSQAGIGWEQIKAAVRIIGLAAPLSYFSD